jgi:hypothetical protein
MPMGLTSKVVNEWKRRVFVLAACLFFLGVSAGYTQADSKLVLGEKTWEEWKSEAGWISYAADYYVPQETKIKTLSQLQNTKDASFVVFGGAWCSITKSQFPVIFKIFDLASISSDKIQLYGVNKKHKEPTRTYKRFRIVNVPTVIVLSQGKEIGRITQHPAVSWEDDMIKILSK